MDCALSYAYKTFFGTVDPKYVLLDIFSFNFIIYYLY